MSKNYKKSNKKVGTNILIGVLFGAVIIGALGAVTKGFKEWDYRKIISNSSTSDTSTTSNSSTNSSSVDNEQALIRVDFKNLLSGSALDNEDKILIFFNDSSEERIFDSVMTITEQLEGVEITTPLFNQLYKDNGGLKFGSSSKLGYVSLKLIEDFTYNRIAVVGYNYSALNSQTQEYSCDESSISINGKAMQAFGTNSADKTNHSPTETKVFTFEDLQSTLEITTSGKRLTILEIHLWTE